MKSMKKSMFVTTILMVVLLIVALSTATFAWYTAQSSVSVNESAVASAASNAASLAIDKANTTASTNSSVTLTMTGAIAPMVMKSAPTAGTTTYADFIDNGSEAEHETFFTGAPVNNQGLFTAAGSDLVPAYIATVTNFDATSSSNDTFYVINTDAINSTHVRVGVSISTTAYTLTKSEPANWEGNESSYFTRSGDTFTAVTGTPSWSANNYYALNTTNVYQDLRVAVFVSGKLLDIWSYAGGTNTYHGTIAANASGSGLSHTYTTLANAAKKDILGAQNEFAAASNKAINVVAWYDGVGLEVAEASSYTFFSLSFEVYNPGA